MNEPNLPISASIRANSVKGTSVYVYKKSIPMVARIDKSIIVDLNCFPGMIQPAGLRHLTARVRYVGSVLATTANDSSAFP